jgi:hypothetical protein
MYMITGAATAGVSRHRRREVPRPRRGRDGGLQREAQQPNGLYFHAPDVKFYWGRGDGWVAVGMAEMLRDLPQKHKRARPSWRPIAR